MKVRYKINMQNDDLNGFLSADVRNYISAHGYSADECQSDQNRWCFADLVHLSVQWRDVGVFSMDSLRIQ